MSSYIAASCTTPNSPLWSRTACGPPQLVSSSSFQFKLLLAPSLLAALHRSLLRARPRWSRLYLTGREETGEGEDGEEVRLILDGLSESAVGRAAEEDGLVVVPARREEERQQEAPLSLSGSARDELLERLMLSLDGFHLSPSLSHYLRLSAAVSASPSHARLHVECLTPSLSLSLSPLPAWSCRLQPSALLQSLLASSSPAGCQGYLTLSAEQELQLLQLPSDALSLPLLGVFTAAAPSSLSAYLLCLHFLYCAALTRLTVAPLTFLLLSFQHSAFSLHEVTARMPDMAVVHSAADLSIALPPLLSPSALLHLELRPVLGSLLPSLSCSTASPAEEAAGCGLYSEGEAELTSEAPPVSPASLRSPSPMAASPPRPHQTPQHAALQSSVVAALKQHRGDLQPQRRAEQESGRPALPRQERPLLEQAQAVEQEHATRLHAEEQGRRRLRATSVRMREEKRRRELVAKKAAQQAAASAAEEERRTRASSSRQRQRLALAVKQRSKVAGVAATQDGQHDRQAEQTAVTTAETEAAALSEPPSPVQPTSVGSAAWTAGAVSGSRAAVVRLDDTRSECEAEERRAWLQRRIKARMERKSRDSRRADIRLQTEQPAGAAACLVAKANSPPSLPELNPAALSLFAAALLHSLVASTLQQQQQQQQASSSQQMAEQLKEEQLQREAKDGTPETTTPAASVSSGHEAVSDSQAVDGTQQAIVPAQQPPQEAAEMAAESESEEEQEMKYPSSPQPSAAVAAEEERQGSAPCAAVSPPASPRSASLSRSSSSASATCSSDSDDPLSPLLLRLPASSPPLSAPLPQASTLPARGELDASIPRISMPALMAGSSSDEEAASSSSSEYERRLWDKYDKPQQRRGSRRRETGRSQPRPAAARAEQLRAAS